MRGHTVTLLHFTVSQKPKWLCNNDLKHAKIITVIKTAGNRSLNNKYLLICLLPREITIITSPYHKHTVYTMQPRLNFWFFSPNRQSTSLHWKSRRWLCNSFTCSCIIHLSLNKASRSKLWVKSEDNQLSVFSCWVFMSESHSIQTSRHASVGPNPHRPRV